jgi:hypothetical protein
MNNHELPAVLTADEQNWVEKKLAALPESSDGPVTLSLFLPEASQVILILAENGDIISWCLMPARDEERAHALTVLLKQVLRHEHEIVSRDVKALADAAIARASAIREDVRPPLPPNS